MARPLRAAACPGPGPAAHRAPAGRVRPAGRPRGRGGHRRRRASRGGGFTARLSPLDSRPASGCACPAWSRRRSSRRTWASSSSLLPRGSDPAADLVALLARAGPAGSIGGAVKRLLQPPSPDRRPRGAVSVAADGCDASPYAATVNSQVIKQPAQQPSCGPGPATRAYVTAFDAAESASNGGSGVTVAGDAPSTYSTTWVASIMSGWSPPPRCDQHAAATGQLPCRHRGRGPIGQRDQSLRLLGQFSPAFRRHPRPTRLADPGRYHAGVHPGGDPAQRSTTSTSRTSSLRSAWSRRPRSAGGRARRSPRQACPTGPACYNQVSSSRSRGLLNAPCGGWPSATSPRR